jgi:hypothetical protein
MLELSRRSATVKREMQPAQQAARQVLHAARVDPGDGCPGRRRVRELCGV